jgi:hypothetical protein
VVARVGQRPRQGRRAALVEREDCGEFVEPDLQLLVDALQHLALEHSAERKAGDGERGQNGHHGKGQEAEAKR